MQSLHTIEPPRWSLCAPFEIDVRQRIDVRQSALGTYLLSIDGTREVRGCILTRDTPNEATEAPPFRLASNPLTTVKDCACIRVGHSGRGVWLDYRNNVYRCNTTSMVTSRGNEYPALDMGLQGLTPFCTLPGILKDQHGELSLDFDEGMGRIVHCDEAGLVSVVGVV